MIAQNETPFEALEAETPNRLISVAAANDQMAMLGFVIVGVFAAAWLLSALVYRVGGYDRLNVEIEA